MGNRSGCPTIETRKFASQARAGGVALRRTARNGAASDPIFSPDGREIAFTGSYDGNSDVYIIPATGGTPRRLTYHPSPDLVIGWTRDGQRVLFRSARESANRSSQLFTVSRDGGFPTPLPLPIAAEGSFIWRLLSLRSGHGRRGVGASRSTGTNLNFD